MGFKNFFKGKKTQTGLRVNSKGKTPNGTPVMGVNKNGKLVTTRTYYGQKYTGNNEPLFSG
jgi:hypothetical protein